eukprot:GHVR01176196.1.p1 GENE.GHVR01176196.1~~GHVR01176196.1.p1  ORF type:complete len:105 (+),score=7.70 GHVR01176196.1:1939-2253(+)
MMYGRMLSEKIEFHGPIVAKYNTEWLVQIINGMLSKGILGYAEHLTKKALTKHKESKGFNWEFYEAIARLKLLQLIQNKKISFKDYEIVPRLIKEEMVKNSKTG